MRGTGGRAATTLFLIAGTILLVVGIAEHTQRLADRLLHAGAAFLVAGAILGAGLLVAHALHHRSP